MSALIVEVVTGAVRMAAFSDVKKCYSGLMSVYLSCLARAPVLIAANSRLLKNFYGRKSSLIFDPSGLQRCLTQPFLVKIA